MKPAADILSKLIAANSQAKAREYASVFSQWRDVAGLSLADHSRVYELRHKSLFVEVDHNGWMQILQLRKARILERLARKYPELGIRDIKVRVNASPTIERSEAPPAPGPEACPPRQSGRGEESDEGQEVERIVSEVPQESLKGQLRRLFLSSLEARRRGPGRDSDPG